MSVKQLTPAIVARTVHVIDTSGVVDLLCPPRQPGTPGRIGAIRQNTRLFLIGARLATVLGHETTVRSVHQVLTESLPRETQWDLGVLRPVTTARATGGDRFDPDTPTLTRAGKPRKRIWDADGVEEVGYDDLYNAVSAMRKRLDYGVGSAPSLDDEERARRRKRVEEVVDALLITTTIPRTGDTWAIDSTGQWAWSRGPVSRKKVLESRLANGKAPDTDDQLETADIAFDESGDTSPPDCDAAPPAGGRGRCLDAAWGYKTAKDGGKETGFGFHKHTIVRVPDPEAPDDAEPVLVDGFVYTPANSDVVAASLNVIDRIRARHPFKRMVGDLLYTNLRAHRWAVPLAERGIEQGLMMSSLKHARVVDVHGAKMQFGWLHCPAADMTLRPLPLDFATPEEWAEYCAKAEAFRDDWAFDRKESGLGRSLTSKWICPAAAGRVGCHARGPANVTNATEQGLPIVTAPSDWATRKCCTNKTLDFTADPTNHHHQRKLMQREYVGSRRWRRLMMRRTFVEGVFGILKNPSRQRLRRGQNRIPGLAMATVIAAVKDSVFNEEQLRAWHERTGLGPADHPLLQPDPPYWGFQDLTKEQAKAIDARRLSEMQGSNGERGARVA